MGYGYFEVVCLRMILLPITQGRKYEEEVAEGKKTMDENIRLYCKKVLRTRGRAEETLAARWIFL